MVGVKKAIKEKIRDILSGMFDYYVPDWEISDALWDHLKSELSLEHWEYDLYCRKSKDIQKGEVIIEKKVEELAEKYGLSEKELQDLWYYIINHLLTELNNAFKEVLKEKGCELMAEYVGVDCDYSGFLIAIDLGNLTDRLSGADLDEVIKKYLNQIDDEQLEQLKQRYFEEIKHSKERGWKFNRQEILESIVEDFLKEEKQKEVLVRLYIGECKNAEKFIKVVKEDLEDCLVSHLSDVEFIEEIVKEMIEANKGQKLSGEQSINL